MLDMARSATHADGQIRARRSLMEQQPSAATVTRDPAAPGRPHRVRVPVAGRARLGVTAEWRGLDWTDDAACADHAEATPGLCGRCPVAGECLAAAVASDDPADWRGGLSRADRECLWAGMERTYRDVRDLELMRIDAGRLPAAPHCQRLDHGQHRTDSAHDHRRPRRHRPVHRHRRGPDPGRAATPQPTAPRATSPTSSPTPSPPPPPTSADPTSSSPDDPAPGNPPTSTAWSEEPWATSPRTGPGSAPNRSWSPSTSPSSSKTNATTPA